MDVPRFLKDLGTISSVIVALVAAMAAVVFLVSSILRPVHQMALPSVASSAPAAGDSSGRSNRPLNDREVVEESP